MFLCIVLALALALILARSIDPLAAAFSPHLSHPSVLPPSPEFRFYLLLFPHFQTSQNRFSLFDGLLSSDEELHWKWQGSVCEQILHLRVGFNLSQTLVTHRAKIQSLFHRNVIDFDDLISNRHSLRLRFPPSANYQ